MRFMQDDSHPIKGHLYVPKADLSGMESLAFTLASFSPARHQGGVSPQLNKPITSTWLIFRLQAVHGFDMRQSKKLRQGRGTQPSQQNFHQPYAAAPDQDDTVAFFSGGRAVGESLQLDRALGTSGVPGEATVDVNSLTGISITPMDWSKKNQGLKPAA